MSAAPRRRSRFLSLLEGDRGAVFLLVLVFFGANWPLLANRVSERIDGESFFAPFYNYVASLARSGHFMLWDPFCNGGSPDFAEPQLGAFSPVTLLCGLIAGPGPTGFHLYWLGVWFLGGLGMYVLARALSAPPWGALVTALAFVFCGFYIGHAEHLSAVYSLSFVPWVLWRVRAAMVTGRWRFACEAGALWGLAALAGNPAVHIPTAMFVGVVALAWLPPVGPDGAQWPRWRIYVITMALLAGVGALVLAPAYGSFRYEVAGYSHRTLPLKRGVVLDQKFGWSWLTALATPAFVPFNGMSGWAEFDISMREIYFGAAVPVFAAWTVWRQRARWQTWLVLGMGLLALGISMGSLLPFRTWLYDGLPFTRYFRHAPMFRGFFVLAMGMLAAPGTAFVESCWRDRATAGKNLRPLAIIAGVCALLGVGSYVWVSLDLPDAAAARLSPLAPWHAGLVWVGLAAFCAAAVRWAGFRRFLPGALVALTALDLTGAYALTGHVAHQDKPSVVAAGPVQPLTDLGPDGFSRTIAALYNTNLYDRKPVFVSYTAMRNFSQEFWGLDRLLRPYVLGPQRVWFAAHVPTVPATPEVFEKFVQRAHAMNALPVVRQERASLLAPGAGLTLDALDALAAAPAAQPLDCRVLAYHDNDFTLQVTCPTDGYVLVTDRWSRSWQATVNGRPVPVDGGDFLFRLVPVQAGENVIAMRFYVPWVYALVALSWSTLAVAGIAALWRLRHPAAGAVPLPIGHGPVPAAEPVAV